MKIEPVEPDPRGCLMQPGLQDTVEPSGYLSPPTLLIYLFTLSPPMVTAWALKYLP